MPVPRSGCRIGCLALIGLCLPPTVEATGSSLNRVGTNPGTFAARFLSVDLHLAIPHEATSRTHRAPWKFSITELGSPLLPSLRYGA